MRIEPDIKLDFSDVLIRPQWSTAPSRASVKLTREFKFNEHVWTGIPIIAANMDTIGTFAMARAMVKHKMMACIHKYYPLEDLEKFFSEEEMNNSCFYTLGIKEDDFAKLEALCEKVTPKFICVDVANANTQFVIDRIKKIRYRFTNSTLMAGNIVTPEMVHHLIVNAGVEIVKVGTGSGALCLTRIVTGCGYPQLSAIIECADAAHGCGGKICSDGGITCPGDIAKGFGGGADFLMIGGFLAGHDECGGEKIDGRMKCYGMSSLEANNKYSGGLKDYKAAEGRCVEVPCKGPVAATLQEITGGLASAATYLGASKLKDFPKCCTFIRVNRTHNTVFEKQS